MTVHNATERCDPVKVPKRAHNFTAEEKAVIRDRLRWQSSAELAVVFGTTARVIANIGRYS